MAPPESVFSPASHPGTVQLRTAISALQDLPGWHPTVQKVLRLAVDPRVDRFQIEVGLSVEPAVAELVLRFADSPFCDSTSRADSIPKVLRSLDHGEFRSLLRTVLIVGLWNSLSEEAPQAERLRESSAAAGAAAFVIAKETQSANPLELLNSGLLHNVGEAAVARVYPEDYAQMEELALSAPRFVAERRALGFECRQLGRRLVESWSLPRIFTEAVEHWRDPLARVVDSEFRRRLCRVHIAVRLSQGYLGGLPFDDIPVDESVLLYSGIGHGRLERVWQRLPQDAENLNAVIHNKSREEDSEGLA